MEQGRKLSTIEYLKFLQLEYLSCKLRSLIYDRPEFVKMNVDIAEKKREKIENLTHKFSMMSMFNSLESFSSFVSNEFVQEFGLPKIQYSTDEKKKRAVSYWDRICLLPLNSEVFYKDQSYLVVDNHPDKECATIKRGMDKIYIPYTYIKMPHVEKLLISDFEQNEKVKRLR